MAQLGIGLVGCGFWGTHMHLPALATALEARVVAVASRSGDHAAAAAAAFDVPRWSTDYRELLEDPDVDVIDLCTPNGRHAEMAIAAARAGKHVICIKPLATTLAEADAMVEAARAAGTRLFYAENALFIPALQRAKEIIDEGALGEVFRVRAAEGIPGPAAGWSRDPAMSGGGAVIDMAVHSLAFLRHIAGAEAAHVYAELGTFVHRDLQVEDTAILTVRFENGVIGQAEDSWATVGEMDSRFEVFGTKGRVLVDMLHSTHLRVYSQAGYTYWGERTEASKGWTYPLPLAEPLMFGTADMFAHFFRCLLRGEQCRSSGADGRAIMSQVDAAYRSARSGRAERPIDNSTYADREAING
jgi:predicted dehydrogenase